MYKFVGDDEDSFYLWILFLINFCCFFKGSVSFDIRIFLKFLYKDKEESKFKKREVEKRSIDKVCFIYSSL